MPAAHGYASEELLEFLDELVEEGVYDSRSEAVGYLLEWAAHNKHGFEE